MSAPAGWYPDPHHPTQGRYWDGTAWTDAVHQPGQPYPATPALKAPAGADGNTGWVWLIIALQVLPLVMFLFVPWGSMFDVDPRDPYASSTASMSVLLSPFYWLALLFGWVGYGLSAFFAYRDHRELLGRGIPKPFHWAFAFIGAAVYTIGRSVVVTRRTGRGRAPMWATIGVIVLSFVVAGVITAQMFTGMASLFEQIGTR
jgi:Protein of unknown function (DUF2510).